MAKARWEHIVTGHPAMGALRWPFKRAPENTDEVEKGNGSSYVGPVASSDYRGYAYHDSRYGSSKGLPKMTWLSYFVHFLEHLFHAAQKPGGGTTE